MATPIFTRDIEGRFATRGGVPVLEFRVTGDGTLLRNLDQLGDGFPLALLQQIVRHAGEPIRDRMEALAPVDPGKPDLRDHIIIADLDPNTDLGFQYDVAVAIGPSRGFFYGFFQEFGTIHNPAQPFARPAFDQGVGPAMTIIDVDISAAIQLMLKRAEHE